MDSMNKIDLLALWTRQNRKRASGRRLPARHARSAVCGTARSCFPLRHTIRKR